MVACEPKIQDTLPHLGERPAQHPRETLALIVQGDLDPRVAQAPRATRRLSGVPCPTCGSIARHRSTMGGIVTSLLKRRIIPTRRIAHTGLLLALTCMLVACGTIVWRQKLPVARYSQDVGNVYVSAYPVVPWSDISKSLEPNRHWNIKDATNQAINVTSTQSLQVISSLAAALGVSIPGGSAPPGSPSGTSAPSSTDGSSSSPAGSTSSTPTPSSASQLPQLPALAALTGLATSDGAQRLVASTALFQQAAILDNQIPDQLIPAHYCAYLLTLQVNLQPSRRDWSYNAFVNITLIPAPFANAYVNSKETLPYNGDQAPVIIKPLIITDALETSSTARSVEEIRQALAQLSAAAGKAGVSGLIGGGHNALQSIAGYRSNSLVTAGVLDDSTLHVRLGAETEGNGNRFLTPRTYNISMMVLTRAGDPVTRERGVFELEAITHTYFEPTARLLGNSNRAPTALPSSRHVDALAGKVRRLILSYGYSPLERNCGTHRDPEGSIESHIGNTNDKGYKRYLNFLRFVTHSDYEAIQDCLHTGPAVALVEQERLYRMLAQINELQDRGRFSRMLIPLGGDGMPRLPSPKQFGIVSDSNGQETVTLMGGRNLRASFLHPRIRLSGKNQAWLFPTKILVTGDGRPSVSIAFDAPSDLTPIGSSGKGDATTLSQLDIALGQGSGRKCNGRTDVCYENFLVNTANKKRSAILPAGCQKQALLSVSATTLWPARDVKGVFAAPIDVSLGDLKAFRATCVTLSADKQKIPVFKQPYRLVVSHADIASFQRSCLMISGAELQPAKNGRCISRLMLDDLVGGSTVNLSLVDRTGKQLPSATVSLGVAYANPH